MQSVIDSMRIPNRWDEKASRKFSEAQFWQYRSNLLGSDLRITKFGGVVVGAIPAEADYFFASDALEKSKGNILNVGAGDIQSFPR